MENNENKKEKSGNDKLKDVFNNAWGFSKKVADNVQKEANVLYEKAKENSYERRMKKYNPVFPKQYKSKDFVVPNMIVISDDIERREIDVCEGAIGWIENSNGMEVLYLYEEAVKMRNIDFIPYPACGTSYYVDNFNKGRYIKIDSIFAKAHEERLAELERIAYELGAKSYSIEIVEENIEDNNYSRNIQSKSNIGFKSVSVSTDNSLNENIQSKKSNQ